MPKCRFCNEDSLTSGVHYISPDQARAFACGRCQGREEAERKLVVNHVIDVRRTVRPMECGRDGGLNGWQVLSVLGALADGLNLMRRECLVSDINGVQLWKVGLSAGAPFTDVAVRVGGDLEREAVNHDVRYYKLGIGSTTWPGPLFVRNYAYDEVIKFVTGVRDAFEQVVRTGKRPEPGSVEL